MVPFLYENFGNPASRSHAYGWAAEEAVEISGEHVAKPIGADAREIVWTSGATESNNLAIKGAHKIYGPKGIGALYMRRKPRVRIEAQIHGGGHERGMRSGTLPTRQIVGMGEADRLAYEGMAAENERVRMLRERLLRGMAPNSTGCAKASTKASSSTTPPPTAAAGRASPSELLNP